MIPGYTIAEEIYRGRKRIVYRCWRDRDKKPVIIKTVFSDYPSSSDVTHLKREHNLIKNLDIEGAAKAYALEIHQNRPILVLEDIGGSALKALIESKKVDVQLFLKIAIGLTDIVGQLHQRNIIHKDINPKNIIVNTEAMQIELIDFSISSKFSQENQKMGHSNLFEGTLAYMSPEQTGRMNRGVDYRTDFYSLGATFYEMLTGTPPFVFAEPLEMVHAHIAKVPASPQQLNARIPEALSKIVMKLLAKTAEERYQSAYGIKADLEFCREQFRKNEKIDNDFIPGRYDFSDRFQIPQKLYGRGQEIETLMAAFARVSKGATETTLVSGYSGIGKSALVNEIHKPIVKQRGYFISGKFDQFKRDVPYSAIILAFQELILQILTENERQIEAWKNQILEAVGPNGQVIIQVIPELELIIGEQPAVPQLPPAESQNRFNLVFKRFMQVFTREEHPVVIFLDDLQWADSATLKLLLALMSDSEIHHLLVIGAYRDNEVSASHPLMLTLSEIEKTGATMNNITLQPLNFIDLNQFVADTLKCETQKSEPFSDLILQKTDGNPFFVAQFLKSLYQQDLLFFIPPVLPAETAPLSQETADGNASGSWEFDLEKIRRLDMTDNVVTLMAGKIQKLSSKTQRVTTLAACIGNQFDLDTLAIVNQESPTQTARALVEATTEGLILPISETGFHIVELEDELEIHDPQQAIFKFLHDRVEQAAYELIPEAQRQGLHLKIGRLMLAHTPGPQQDEKLFDIVNHLNHGKDLIDAPEERIRFAALNLQAGRKAKASTAYSSALNFLSVGLDFLGPDSWQAVYDMTFALYRELAECEYLCGNFDQAESHFQLLLSRGKTDLEKAEVYNMRIIQYENMAEYEQAVEVGKDSLKLFGIALPEADADKQAAFENEMLGIRMILGKRKITDLIDLPVMTNPAIKMSMKLLMTMWAPAYIAGDGLLTILISAKMVRLSLEYGNAEESAYSYVIHAVTVATKLKDFQTAHDLGRLALAINEKFNDQKLRAKIHHMFSCFVNFWRQPLKTCFPYSKEAYRVGLETGDFVYATYAVIHESWHALLSGFELSQFIKDYTVNVNFLRQIKNHSFADAQELILHWSMNLQGLTQGKLSLTSAGLDEKAYLETYTGNPFFETFYFVIKLHIAFTFEEYEVAVEIAEKAESVIHALHGTLWDSVLCFYHALSLAAVCGISDKVARKKYRKKLEELCATLKLWADNCPENFLNQFLLVSAELARISSEHEAAINLYEQAMSSARENGFLQNDALANELYAKFWLLRKNEQLARYFFKEAQHRYKQWGAQAKVLDLEEKYSGSPAHSPTFDTITQTGSAIGLATISGIGQTLDLTAVIRASQLISGEIVLNQLLEKLMTVVLENAGAERGFLIMEKADDWVIEAEGRVEPDAVNVLQSVPLNQADDGGEMPPMSIAIVNYVRRTHLSLVLTDARSDAKFAEDPYVLATQPRSILCAPMLTQGRLVGILYLENNLTSGAFTADRIEVVQILASQAAISLENARLYYEKDEEVNERKRVENMLRTISVGTAVVSSGDFFRSLVQHLSSALQVRVAFVAECMDGGMSRVRTLAFIENGAFKENIEYDLEGTPCLEVISGKICTYTDKLDELFPKESGFKSYIGVPLRDSSGDLLGHLAVMDDEPILREGDHQSILEIFAARAGVELQRTHAEEALKKSEERFRTLFESAPIGVSVNNAKGKFLLVNKTFEQMLGYSEDELKSKNFKDVTFPEDWDESMRFFGELITGGRQEFRVEKRYEKKDGGQFWTFTSCAAVRDAAGRFLYTFAMIADITERKNAEQALRQALTEVEKLKKQLQAENIYLQEEIKTEQNFEEIIGVSSAIRKVTHRIESVAITDATVLITGETGTGKELIARAIHNLSNRRERPLIKVNCAALPSGLVESEFFGHEKGAFTGAIGRKLGRFELADGGTIFLDEIGDVPLDVQVKLLRVLQEQEFERVGGTETKKVNVRLIAATNCDLTQAVKENTFRADLYYRLNVFPIHVPPLRERKEDISLLVHYYVNKFKIKMGKQTQEIDRETIRLLEGYDWPGNVRELSNLIERALILSPGPVLKIEREALRSSEIEVVTEGELFSLDQIERNHIVKILDETHWVINGPKGAAEILGLHPNTLRHRMQKLGIHRQTHHVS